MANGFNFAKKPFVNERLPRLVLSLTAAFAIGLTLVHGFFLTRYLVREQEALDIKVEELQSSLTKTESDISQTRGALAREQTALQNERTQFLTRLYRHKGFSWTGLFNELETITPGPVRITSITPAEEDGEMTVTLTLVGRTLEDVLAMVRELEGSSFFATVFPVDEAPLDERIGQSETGIAATLRLTYVEETQERNALPSPTAADEPAPVTATVDDEAPAADEEAPPEAVSPEDEPAPPAEVPPMPVSAEPTVGAEPPPDENEGEIDELDALGYEYDADEELDALGVLGYTEEEIEELKALGYTDEEIEELKALNYTDEELASEEEEAPRKRRPPREPEGGSP